MFSDYNTPECRACVRQTASTSWKKLKSSYAPARALDSVWSFFGKGDYTLKSNSLVDAGGSISSGVKIQPAGPRETRIIYREYIGDVVSDSAGGFKLGSYLINPGNADLFPWLSTVARCYEQWTPNGIMFEFKSTSSEYVSSQALGSVIMATDYDTYDTLYANKVEMLNSAYSNEAKPSQHILHGIECDPRDTPNMIMYCDHGDIPSGADQRDYYLGRFQIATQGGPASAVTLGSLYVHYDITFRKESVPKLLSMAYFAKFSFTPTTAGLISPFGIAAQTQGSYGEWSVTYPTNQFTINPPFSIQARYYVFILTHALTAGGTGNLLVDDVAEGIHVNGSKVSLSWGNSGSSSTWAISPTLPATVGIKYWANAWVMKAEGGNVQTTFKFDNTQGGLAEAGKPLIQCTLSIAEVSEDFALTEPVSTYV